MNTGPVFIGGLSYSGKTLLRLLLSPLPDMVITRRTRLWTRYYKRFGDLRHPNNFDRCLQSMLSSRPIQALDPDPDRIRQEFWQGRPTYERLFGLIHAHYAERVGKLRWGDQLNGIEWFADQIFAAYPGAQMIHLVRDPRDRYRATLRASMNRPGKVGWEIAQWRRSAWLAARNGRMYPEHYLVVLFEHLVSDTEKSLQQICSFLNEDATPVLASLREAFDFGSGNPQTILSVSDALEQSGSLNKIRTLSNPEVAFIQGASKQAMSAFGYEVDRLKFSLKDWVSFISFQGPINLTSMMVRQTSQRLRGI